MGSRRQVGPRHRRGHAGAAGLARRCRDRQGHAPHQGRPLRQCPRASERRRDRDHERHHGAGRSVPARPQRQGHAPDQHQPRPLAQLDPVKLKKFSFTGANNDKVWGWTLKPAGPQYAAVAKLPIAFVVHGGPQGSFGNSWSYRWNPRLFAAPGYAAVSVDFHGSTGYGQAFTDAINKNWGGWPLEDLQKGLAYATANDPQLDADNACALGASYGGYMMNWIAGKWPDRFKCLVQHDGVFDARAMAYETEELWFDEWEHGGQGLLRGAGRVREVEPGQFVQNWKTPMLVITGEKDFRIPYTQGLAAFTALQRATSRRACWSSRTRTTGC